MDGFKVKRLKLVLMILAALLPCLAWSQDSMLTSRQVLAEPVAGHALRDFLTGVARPCRACYRDTVPNHNIHIARVDLDGDDVNDVLLSSDEQTNAQAGNVWSVYLSRKGGRFPEDELISFRTDAFRVVHTTATDGDLIAAYLPGGGGQGIWIGIGCKDGVLITAPLVDIAPDAEVKDEAADLPSEGVLHEFTLLELRKWLPEIFAPPPTSLFPVPRLGEPIEYYDLDASGRLLRIDYAGRRATVLGRIPVDAFAPSAVPWGDFVVGGDCLHLFSSTPGKSPAHLLRYDLTDGVISRVATPFEALSFCGAQPISRSGSAFSYLDEAGAYVSRLVTFDGQTEVTVLNPGAGPALPVISDASSLYTYHPSSTQSSLVLKVDLRSGETVDEIHAEQIPQADASEVYLPIGAIDGAYAVLLKHLNDAEGSTVYLLDLDRKEIIARTRNPILRVGATWQIGPILGEQSHLLSFEHPPILRDDSVSECTMHLFTVDLGAGEISLAKTMLYDPAREIPLLKADTGIEVFARYRFDYVSMRDLIAPWSDSAPQTSQEREAAIRDLQTHLVDQSTIPPWALGNPTPYSITVEHLHIED
ncbi:MAG: hypothetical protein AMXMBFR82_52190 [Candidatus Hydrogenedentota bacterium]